MIKERTIKLLAIIVGTAILIPFAHAVLVLHPGSGAPLASAARSDLLFLFYEIPILISGLLAVVMETQRRRILGSIDQKSTLVLFTILGVLAPGISFILSPIPARVSIELFLLTCGSGAAIGLGSGWCYWKLILGSR
jgi:hypothetical protein